MTKCITLVGLLLIGSWTSLTYGGSPPSQLQGVVVSVHVRKDNRTGIFAYRYRVLNPPVNDGQIRSVDIEISRSTGEAMLPREGLVNGPRYTRHASEDAFRRVPMVPVGISGPEGWTSGLGFDAQIMTVGPKAPPQNFVPIEFLNYLITLLHDSRQHGWVREGKEAKELLKILLKAKRRLEANEPAKAAKRIEKFLKEVREESCQDFRCRRDKALTSEAYALLFFNGQFLLERLPPTSRERDDEEDD